MLALNCLKTNEGLHPDLSWDAASGFWHEYIHIFMRRRKNKASFQGCCISAAPYWCPHTCAGWKMSTLVWRAQMPLILCGSVALMRILAGILRPLIPAGERFGFQVVRVNAKGRRGGGLLLRHLGPSKTSGKDTLMCSFHAVHMSPWYELKTASQRCGWDAAAQKRAKISTNKAQNSLFSSEKNPHIWCNVIPKTWTKNSLKAATSITAFCFLKDIYKNKPHFKTRN